MIELDVNQDLVPAKYRFSQTDILRFQEALREIPKEITGTIAIEFVDDNRIQRLNRMYRAKDKVTDVLSFTYDTEPGTHLGDVVISYPQAERQAEAGDIRLEITDLIVHGVLHVLGYDHEQSRDAEVMFPLQDTLVSTLI